MTDPTVVAAASVLVIGAITTATVAIMRQQTAGKLEILAATAQAADANAKQGEVVAAIKQDVALVEHQTNSINTRHEATITNQETQLAMLRDTIAKMEKIALQLAANPGGPSAALSLEENTRLTREILDRTPPKGTP